jgi:hypothetical protein
VKGFLLGGTAWLAIPWCFATTLGLSAVALRSQPDFPISLTAANVSAGLPAPAAAAALLGQTGGSELHSSFRSSLIKTIYPRPVYSPHAPYPLPGRHLSCFCRTRRRRFHAHLCVVVFSAFFFHRLTKLLLPPPPLPHLRTHLYRRRLRPLDQPRRWQRSAPSRGPFLRSDVGSAHGTPRDDFPRHRGEHGVFIRADGYNPGRSGRSGRSRCVFPFFPSSATAADTISPSPSSGLLRC